MTVPAPERAAARRVLVGILLLCLLARVAFVVLFGDRLSLEASGYDVYAVNLLAGDGYTRFDDLHSDSDLPPLYAIFLAGVYTVLGRDARAVAAVQIAFDLLTVSLVYLIGRRMLGAHVGLIAAALTAFYPYLLFQDLTVNDTALFTFLLTLTVYLSYRALDTQAARWAAAVGATLGMAALTKTLALLMLPLLGLWWLRRLGLVSSLRLAGAMLLLAVLVITPWVARNIALHGRFVLISTNGGSNLHQGNNPCTVPYLLAGWDPQWTGHCWDQPPSGLSDVEMDGWHTQQALAYLSEDAGRALELLLVKFLALWSPTIAPAAVPPDLVDEVGLVLQYEQPAFQAARVVHLLYFGPLLALGVGGLALAWKQRALVYPAVAVFLAITLTYMAYHPSTRYRIPLDPLLFILSAYALERLWRAWRTRTPA